MDVASKKDALRISKDDLWNYVILAFLSGSVFFIWRYFDAVDSSNALWVIVLVFLFITSCIIMGIILLTEVACHYILMRYFKYLRETCFAINYMNFIKRYAQYILAII